MLNQAICPYLIASRIFARDFCRKLLQKATQDARALSSMTRERDHLLQELAACNQMLAAAGVRASEQDAAAAQKAAQMLRVGLEELASHRLHR